MNKKNKKCRFLQELEKAFDYRNGLTEKERIKREQGMAEVNKIKLELERRSRLNYKNLIEQIIRNENLATGLRVWAMHELDRTNYDDVVRLRRQQIKKMWKMQNEIVNIAVKTDVSSSMRDVLSNLYGK